MVAAGIVRLLRDLDKQARKEGGAVYMLNGNHESLNVCGDFRYDAQPVAGALFSLRQWFQRMWPAADVHLVTRGSTANLATNILQGCPVTCWCCRTVVRGMARSRCSGVLGNAGSGR